MIASTLAPVRCGIASFIAADTRLCSPISDTVSAQRSPSGRFSVPVICLAGSRCIPALLFGIRGANYLNIALEYRNGAGIALPLDAAVNFDEWWARCVEDADGIDGAQALCEAAGGLRQTDLRLHLLNTALITVNGIDASSVQIDQSMAIPLRAQPDLNVPICRESHIHPGAAQVGWTNRSSSVWPVDDERPFFVGRKRPDALRAPGKFQRPLYRRVAIDLRSVFAGATTRC